MTAWVNDPKARGLTQVAVWVPHNAAGEVEAFARDIRIRSGHAMREDLPTEKQMVAIVRLCSERHIAVPPEALASRPAAEAFIAAAAATATSDGGEVRLPPTLTALPGGR